MAAEAGGGGTPRGGAASRRPGAGTSDARVARARELHRKAVEADALAARQRAERDAIIRKLRAEDPERWSYGKLASALGCSRELIALVAKRAERE